MKRILLILFIFCQSLLAEEPTNINRHLDIASQAIAPYYFEKSPDEVDGYFYKIFKAVCERAQLDCHFKVYPFRRVLQYLIQGDIQMSAPMAQSADREKDMDFSEIIYSSGYQFFGKKDFINNIKNLKEIKGKVGVHSPSSTSNTLKSLQKEFKLDITIIEETDVDMAFEKLKKGRYDLIFMNKDISNIWAKKNNTKKISFKSYDKYIFAVDYRIAFTKKVQSKQADSLWRFKKELSLFLKSREFKKLSDAL